MTTRTVSVELQAKVDRYAANMERAAAATTQADKSAAAAQRSVTALQAAEAKAASVTAKYGEKSEQAARANAQLARAQKTATTSTDRAALATNKAATAADRLGRETDQTTAKVNKADGASRRMGLGYAIGGAAAVLALKQVIGAASSLEESVSKSNVVFGSSAAGIQTWAEGAAENMGMAEQVALEAAGTFGNLFTSMKIGQKPAADMSTTIVQLAADLASFNNVTPEDALLALRAGLVGEVEPLRKFGINLNDVELRQKALAMRLTNTTKEVLPPAIKAQAAYALIMEQSKNAQGDFARTADGVANSQRILTAQITDAKAKIGAQLLPAYKELLTVTGGVLGVFDSLSPSTQRTVLELGALATAAAIVVPKLRAIRDGMRGVGLGIGKGAGIAALAVIGVAAGNAALDFAKMGRKIEALNDALGKPMTTSGLEELRTKLAEVKSAQDDLTGGFDGGWLSDIGYAALHSTDGLGMMFDELRTGSNVMDRSREATAAAQAELSAMTQVIWRTANATGRSTAELRTLAEGYEIDLSGGVDAAVVAFSAYSDRAGAVTSASGEAAGATRVLADETATLAEQTEAYNTSLEKTIGLELQRRGGARAVEAALDAARAAVKKNGQTLDIHTAKGRANGEALDGIADSAMNYAEKVREATGDTDKANAIVAKGREDYVRMATAMTGSAKKAERLATEIFGVRKQASKPIPAVEVDFKIDESVPWYLRRQSGQVTVHVTGDKAVRDATGGYIRGPGTSTSDSIPARLSNGEYVVQASAVSKYGIGMLDLINARGFAAGGSVGASPTVDLAKFLTAWQAAFTGSSAGAVTDARTGVRDAKESLSDARESRSDARRNVRETRADNKAEEAAQRRVVAKTKNAKKRAAEQAKLDKMERDNAEELRDAKEGLSDAERDLADARKANTQAQADLAAEEKKYQAGLASPAAQLASALGAGIKSTGTFITNLQTLAGKGYGDLANQLLAMGGPEAEAIAASAVKLPAKDLAALSGQVATAAGQQATLDAMPTVFTILGALAKNPKAGAGELARATGLSVAELETAGATAKDSIRRAGGDVFLADMAAAGFAGGGPVRGRGTSTSDSIPTRLSVGEYVISATAAARVGRSNLDRLNAGTSTTGGTVYAPTFTVTNVFDGITDTDELAGHVEEVAAKVTEQAFAAFDHGSRSA